MTQVFLQTSPSGLGFNAPRFPGSLSELEQMNEISQFSFPAGSAVGGREENVPDSTTLQSLPVERKKAHRRALTSVQATPLPTFSFGGGPTEEQSAMTPSSTQASPDLGLAPITASSRHRRAVSELIGEKSTETQDGRPSIPSIQPASGYRPTRMSHRHRRSGAVDSQDLSSLGTSNSFAAEPRSLQPAPTTLDPLPSGFDHDTVDVTPIIAANTPSSTEESATVPRTVTFSDQVDTIQPRPISMVSTESSSSQSTIRGTNLSCVEDSPSPPRFDGSDSLVVMRQEASTDVAPMHEVAGFGTGVGIVELNENFDGDPTAASTTIADHGSYLPLEDFTTAPPTHLPSTSPTKAAHDSPTAAIDLDLASVDIESSPTRTSLRGSGFQKARASMHSAGSQSGLLSSTLSMHRRTESAPSLTPVPFLLRSHDKAADAGFEMTDVFEEEEDEDDDMSMVSSSAATPLEDRHSFVSSRSDRSSTPKPLAEARATHFSPPLLPGIQFDVWESSNQSYAGPSEMRDEGDDFSLPRPPFIVVKSEPSVSTTSSPRCTYSGMSSCEPSPSFQHSVEDVPSLISSGSTVGETTLPNASLRSFEPPITLAAESRSSLAPSNGTHRKRLSVMSMSVSRLFSGSNPAIDQPEQFGTARSQSTAGLQPSKTTKTKRFSQMLKFWKKPSTSPYT